MAKSTVTKTDDLTAEDLTAKAEDTLPTREQMVARIEEATDPNVVAKVDAPKTVKVTSPAGTTTEVPEGIVDALLESGYSKSK
jgi:hypothetical protein